MTITLGHALRTPFAAPAPHRPHRSAADLLALWFRRSASRADLSRMDRRALADIGLSRFEADVECAKPFWRA